jgi:hypothetical protein
MLTMLARDLAGLLFLALLAVGALYLAAVGQLEVEST